MFMIATIQRNVTGTPTHSGNSWMPRNGNVNRSMAMPNPSGIAAATLCPPSFAHHDSPRKSSTTPTKVATAAPSRIPR